MWYLQEIRLKYLDSGSSDKLQQKLKFFWCTPLKTNPIYSVAPLSPFHVQNYFLVKHVEKTLTYEFGEISEGFLHTDSESHKVFEYQNYHSLLLFSSEQSALFLQTCCPGTKRTSCFVSITQLDFDRDKWSSAEFPGNQNWTESLSISHKM